MGFDLPNVQDIEHLPHPHIPCRSLRGRGWSRARDRGRGRGKGRGWARARAGLYG